MLLGSGPASLTPTQHNLRVDATQVKSLTTVRHDLSCKIQERKRQLQALQSRWGSPYSGDLALTDPELELWEVELERYTSLAVAPTAHLPRGMIARIALRLLGGPAAQHTNYAMCGFHECAQIANLAVCQYCSSCVCSRHRILSGNVGYDAKHKDKALGGLNCQCFAPEVCAVNQKRVMQYLGVPEHIVRFQPKVKGTGKGKDKAGKGESKRWSSSSSSGWRPQ